MPHINEAPKHSDKLVHVITYVVFTLLWFTFFYILQAKTNDFKQSLIKSCGFALVYGIIIEALQALVTSSRSADFNDFLANLVGICAAVLVIYAFKSQFLKVKSKF
ncbi:VanZ family protein [Leeuwenhoekiella nanhaiensis]|nr:VanZ family protein [Leeuwenhoekiella nanhaiensis]